ncbi:MAG: hypothetical protein IK028_01175 [Bacilli bacterium]|nr:hypothetical protein [Bacilli bacterium]
MSETRLEKYKKYRQSINEFKSINNEPESIKERNNSIVSDKMNTTSTLPLEEVLGKIDDQEVDAAPRRVLTRKLITIIAVAFAGLVLVAGIIIFAICAFGGK